MAGVLSLIETELAQPAPAAVVRLAAQLAGRANGGAAAVLFYGSNLRDTTLDGVLDFYILLDDVRAWPGSRLAAFANRLLPPNVGYFEGPIEGTTLRAKYAVISVDQFRAGTSREALDTTLWARFSQPCRCVWSRSATDFTVVTEIVQQAVKTASLWAAALGPERGQALEYWRALFAQTYGAELRVETSARGDDLVSRNATYYAALLPEVWRAAGQRFDVLADGTLVPLFESTSKTTARRRWALRQRLGKPLNIARLMKAALTFDGAAEYVVWKVERHSGVRLELRDWQRRHPLLAAPGLYYRLRRLGVIR